MKTSSARFYFPRLFSLLEQLNRLPQLLSRELKRQWPHQHKTVTGESPPDRSHLSPANTAPCFGEMMNKVLVGHPPLAVFTIDHTQFRLSGLGHATPHHGAGDHEKHVLFLFCVVTLFYLRLSWESIEQGACRVSTFTSRVVYVSAFK